MAIVFLSKKGFFILDKDKGKDYIKNFYPGDYTVGKNYFHIKANKINLEKIQKNFEEKDIDKTCYLFELQDHLKNSTLKQNTKKTYFSINLSLLKTINKSPEYITKEDIERFLSILKRRGKSKNTLGVAYSALKYFYSSILSKIDFKEIKRPSLDLPISGSLSRAEIKKIINSLQNKKHVLLIKIAYGCGLKLNEAIRIKKEDIDLKNKILHVRENRKIPIPDSLINDLESYIKEIKSNFLFYSEKSVHRHISPRAAEYIFKNSLEKAGIKRNLSFKSLRDSFVIHLIDKNVNPDLIRKIIGVKEYQFKNKYGFYLNFINHIPDLLVFD